jgi:Pterin binding enzyme
VSYDDVVSDVLNVTLSLASRAVAVGVEPDRILIDPAHDFGKNTWHSLEITRRLGELVTTGWPVLVSVSNKDFVGETLDVPVDDRLAGTLATTAVCAWLGARGVPCSSRARDPSRVEHDLGDPRRRPAWARSQRAGLAVYPISPTRTRRC